MWVGGGWETTEDNLAHIIAKGWKVARTVGDDRVRVPFSKGFNYTIHPKHRNGPLSDQSNFFRAKAIKQKKNNQQYRGLKKRSG